MGDHDSYSDSLEFWHEFAEIHSLNRGACASNVATNAANDAPISHRDDRVRDQREDAAQAGLHAGGSSGSQGDRRGAHWQRSALVQCGSASSAGRGRQGIEPGRAEEVLPDREARNDLGVVWADGGAEVRQLRKQGRSTAEKERHSEAGGRDGQLIRNVGPTNDNGADGKVAHRSRLGWLLNFYYREAPERRRRIFGQDGDHGAVQRCMVSSACTKTRGSYWPL